MHDTHHFNIFGVSTGVYACGCLRSFGVGGGGFGRVNDFGVCTLGGFSAFCDVGATDEVCDFGGFGDGVLTGTHRLGGVTSAGFGGGCIRDLSGIRDLGGVKTLGGFGTVAGARFCFHVKGVVVNCNAFGVLRSFNGVGGCFFIDIFAGVTGVSGDSPNFFVAVGTVTDPDGVGVVVASIDAGDFGGFCAIADACSAVIRFGAVIGLCDVGPNFFDTFGTVTGLDGVGVVVASGNVCFSIDSFGGVTGLGGDSPNFFVVVVTVTEAFDRFSAIADACSVVDRIGAVIGLSDAGPIFFDAFGTVIGLNDVGVAVAFSDAGCHLCAVGA